MLVTICGALLLLLPIFNWTRPLTKIMKRQFVLLGLLILRLGNVGTYPMESKRAFKLANMMNNDGREKYILNNLLKLEKELEVYILNNDNDNSIENEPCINLGNDGCLNGYIVGSGGNKGFLLGTGNPGK